MTQWNKRIPFKVDIAGVIDIMGTSLYSRPDTPIRELLQNAHDAIMRRRQADLGFQGRIDVRQDEEAGEISFHDDGIGLTAQEAEAYLGTLGVGITGLIRRQDNDVKSGPTLEQGDLIGQFGVGLFSAFMLADRLIVDSRNEAQGESVRWEAGPGTEIELTQGERTQSGTTVTLKLKPSCRWLAQDHEALEKAIRHHADFLPIPIYLNDADSRVNVIQVAWFDPSPDRESVELAIQQYFDESPLDVIPMRLERPVSIAGALYVTPQRVPGFSDMASVMTTIRRMVISRRIQGLLPPWATFLRGCLELHDCHPTASREDLVRNEAFDAVQTVLESLIFEHFENLALHDPQRLEATIHWHRYTFAGAALTNFRLRQLLRSCYRLPTSHGSLTIDELFERSAADPLYENENLDRVVWYNTDRRQERWINSLFTEHDAPCAHAFRSFEESLLAQCVADDFSSGVETALRIATPGSPHFASAVLGISDLEAIAPDWQEFFQAVDGKILVGSFRADQPVMAFLNERYELAKSFDEMKQRGDIPAGFQRLIDAHFQEAPAVDNEVILNREHPLIRRALSQQPGTPLSSVMRLIVANSLNSAGAQNSDQIQRQQRDDLNWIAECLWGRE